jgi:hypothetical protein
MSGLLRVDAGQPNIAPPADLLSRKSPVFAHLDEVLDDQELKLADKRSLLASWASDALAVEDSPSLRQLANGAVVRVDDIMAALKSLDLNEPGQEASLRFFQSFARRGSKATARRRNQRAEDDKEPPPSAASAGIPTHRKNLTACSFRHRQLMGENYWRTIRGWKPERVRGARSTASIPMRLRWKRVA